MATKNLFVYVPKEAVANFKTNHTGSSISNTDDYYGKIAFLSESGEIATHGETFGMSVEFANKIGLISDITTSNTLMSYITNVKNAVNTLNADSNTDGSVDKKIKTAIDDLVAGAPTAYDTITEIAAWINNIQGEQGTAAKVSETLAKVPVLEEKLGTYSGSTYSGTYLFAHNAAVEEAAAKVATLTYNDSVATGKYVSAVSQTNGIISVERADLPTLSINSGSSNYAIANGHELSISTSSISSTTGFVYNATPAEGHTTYEVGTAETIGNGLVTASTVYDRLRADETFVASALSTIDARISAVVSSATNDLDSSITFSDASSYVSITVAQEDGKLKQSSSVVTFDYEKIYAQLDSTISLTAAANGTTYGTATIAMVDGKFDSTNSSMTINKDNILAKTQSTVDSSNNTYIAVHVTTQNHDVTTVTVDFDPWEVYSAS